MIREFVADRGDAGVRLDRVLGRHLGDLRAPSRTRVQTWVAEGRVSVNGAPSDKPSRRLLFGDRVSVDAPDPPPRRVHQPEALPLDVVYEDDWLLALDKPPGLVVHPTGGHRAGTLFNALLWRAQSWPSGHRPGLVHRLDRDTSGLLLVAKDPTTHARLARSMTRRSIVKRYLALVYGVPPAPKGRVALALVRGAGRAPRMVTSRHEGRPSITDYEELARSTGAASGLSLLHCTLVTGRMHQIRAHLQASGVPLVGDPVYGEPGWKGLADTTLADACRRFGRQALHAHEIELAHPQSQAPLSLVAPMPDDLRSIIGLASWDRDLSCLMGHGVIRVSQTG